MASNTTQGRPGPVSDPAIYGVTSQGFIVKPFQAILNDTFARAQQLFGPDIDLRSSSTIRKMIELGCLDAALLWMTLDDVYHSGFTSTASGGSLDLLGADLGLDRASLKAAGQVTFKLTSAAPAKSVLTLPPGTLVSTASPGSVDFRLSRVLRLSNDPDPAQPAAQATVPVVAVLPGVSSNVAANQIVRINPTFAARYLSFDASYIALSNAAAFSGGEGFEDDGSYRRKLQAQPRTFWTAEAIRETVLALDTVRDVLVSDPYGGLDTSASTFGGACFGEATFRVPREVGNPYFFSIVVASAFGVLWETEGDAPDQIVGLREQILAALEPIRPISTFPMLVQADSVEVAFRAQLMLQPGADSGGVRAAAMAAVADYITSLRLGDAVLYSQVLRVLTELPGVVDVQNLRLRRCPSRFGEVVFGPPVIYADPNATAPFEAPCGGNLTLAPNEVAVFAAPNEVGPDGSNLLDLEVQPQ
jgi:phage-related baseplate assembly protein